MESMAADKCGLSSSHKLTPPPMITLSQRFGVEVDSMQITDADVITALEYDLEGMYLATGDKGGRIVVFDRVESHTIFTHCEREGAEAKDICKQNLDSEEEGVLIGDWKPYCQFKSHDAEFDYLKSLEIEEKINQIKFLPQIGNNKFLLATNDKTIKLWKVGERHVIDVNSGCEGNQHVKSFEELVLPRMTRRKKILATPKRVYENGHMYHINSISPNSDQETFLSADDLRINWWHMDRIDTSFNIVDIKPPVMEDLTRVITTAQFHPQHCHILMYGLSTGCLKVVDNREAALCDDCARILECPNSSMGQSFFSEIISSISDANFSQDGRYIVTRDYMTIKIWDLHMEREPIQTMVVDERLGVQLPDLYENDSIFDKFEARFSADGERVITGGYNNEFTIWDSRKGRMLSIVNLAQAHKTSNDAKLMMDTSARMLGTPMAGIDKKILHCTFHPCDNTLSIAGQTALFLFKPTI